MQDSYRELFLSESQEYLSTISNCLVKLEENPADLESLNEIFRCMHTIKGMSATMGFEKLTQLSHQMENLLDELRSQKKKVTSEIIDILFSVVDIFSQLIEEIKNKEESKTDISACLENIKTILSGSEAPPEAHPVSAPAARENDDVAVPESLTIDETGFDFSDEEVKHLRRAKDSGEWIYRVRIGISRECVMKEARAFLVITNLKKIGEVVVSNPSLDELKMGRFEGSFDVILITKEATDILKQDILNISEVESVAVSQVELPLLKTAAAGNGTAAPNPQQAPTYVKKIQSMRIPVERLDKIMNLMGELAIAKIRLVQISQNSDNDALEGTTVVLDRLISSLQDEIMQTRLLPAAYILDTFPRMVRDLAHKEGKEIELQIIGSEIELDRVALDEISNPLVHLIRNAIDHGIETPAQRRAAKKPACGKLIIQVTRQKGQIFIEIIDDGRGVDFEAVKRTALNKGLITPEEAASIDEKKILDLITMPGFSTAKQVTDISGRGVGLDVVKSKIESLGGMLEFETKFHEGSRFILTLPLTLAIIKAMLVKVREETFALPLMSVQEIIKIREADLRFIHSLEVAKIREEIIPIIRLARELDIGAGASEVQDAEGRIAVIVIDYGKKSIGLVVDEVLGEQDIVVKPLGAMFKRTKGIAGATILGDGRVALILDTMSLR